MPNQEQEGQEDRTRKLPLGVRLLRTLEGHKKNVQCVAFDPTGQMLASGSADETVKLWEIASGILLRTLKENHGPVCCIAFDPKGQTLVTGTSQGEVMHWAVHSGTLLRRLGWHSKSVNSVTFDPEGRMVVSGGASGKVELHDARSGVYIRNLEQNESSVYSVRFNPNGQILAIGSADTRIWLWEGELSHALNAHNHTVSNLTFSPDGRLLASGGFDKTVRLWDMSTSKLLRTLEGHTSHVVAVAFSANGELLASRSEEGTVRLWSCETWETIAVIPAPINPSWFPCLTFHPILPLLATVGSELNAQPDEQSKLIYLYELDLDVLLGKALGTRPAIQAIHHTTAKIVLVGDSGVGKTGLGWRLAHGEFKEHASTHGQQFWVVNELGTRRLDGTECEAIIWDLAGQPDYRLTHALFLNDSDLALILFDPTDSRDPLHGVEFWLKQLNTGQAAHSSQPVCQTILIGARADRGEARLTQAELDEFCRRRGVLGGYLATSAKEEIGLEELLKRMKDQIPWEQKSATVTTLTFKRIKDYVLKLKEDRHRRKVIVSPPELRKQLEKTDKAWQFTDAEMMTAVGHLANYGYVHVLRTSKGEERVLLAPELLNNLAASFVLEARHNPKGLGALEETRLLAGKYQFRELKKLSAEEGEVLLDAAALLFLEHNVCFRETDPLSSQSYLVFPELINLKKPLLEDEMPTEDGVAYTVSGAVENVYASLVVLLGYTQTFTRTDQWRSQARYEVGDQARYEVGDGLICGFRQDAECDGELDLVLYFGTNVGQPVRTLFQGLFECFLARRNLNVFRYEPAICANGHVVNRAVVRDHLRSAKGFAFCPECGDKVALPKTDEPIQLTRTEKREVEEQQWFANQRSRFEQAIFQIMSYVESQQIARPKCFISYAWGDRAQERWVERTLATDLQKAGIQVVLDRWENARIGASVMRFMERIEQCNKVIVVGTPAYQDKYASKDTERGYVLASEGNLIALRKLGQPGQRDSVLPVLLQGEEREAFPLWLQGNVYADFRSERQYFITAFDLILSMYEIAPNEKAVADLRESLQEHQWL